MSQEAVNAEVYKIMGDTVRKLHEMQETGQIGLLLTLVGRTLTSWERG